MVKNKVLVELLKRNITTASSLHNYFDKILKHIGFKNVFYQSDMEKHMVEYFDFQHINYYENKSDEHNWEKVVDYKTRPIAVLSTVATGLPCYPTGGTEDNFWHVDNSGDDDDTLETFITDDQNVIGTITANNLNMGDHELGVYATPGLVKMLTAVSDDLDVKVNDVDGTAVSIDMKDKDVNMKFMLADLSVIRQVPDLK